jgi:HD superfamily phosphodiesterase
MINVEIIKQKVLSFLEKGISNELTYHNIGHTLYVLKQSEKIAQHEQVDKA